MPYQHKWLGKYIWLFRGKNALFTHAILVETQCTGKLLQGKICLLSIDNMTRPIMKNVPVVTMALMYLFLCIYIAVGTFLLYMLYGVFDD